MRHFRYESRQKPPAPFRHFLQRVAVHFLLAIAVLGCSLAIGICGYMYYEHLGWRDAFLNAAMLLGGMGPVDPPHSPGGKLFAGSYALYAGLVFLIAVGLVLAPVFHRVLHRFHWDKE